MGGRGLNCRPSDVRIVVAARVLKPMGNLKPKTVKYFASADLLEHIKDRNWLVRMTNTVYPHWQGALMDAIQITASDERTRSP